MTNNVRAEEVVKGIACALVVVFSVCLRSVDARVLPSPMPATDSATPASSGGVAPDRRQRGSDELETAATAAAASAASEATQKQTPRNNQQRVNNKAANPPALPATTAVVSTSLEFREALARGEITSILIKENLKLRWYNGWGGGSVWGGDQIFRSTNVTISSMPGGTRKEIDFGGVTLLGMSYLLDGIVLTLNRLVLKNIRPKSQKALESDLAGTKIVVNDSIIHLLVDRGFLSGISSIVGDSEESQEHTLYMPSECSMDGEDIECPDGGWYFKEFQQGVGGACCNVEEMASMGMFDVTHSFVSMEIYKGAWPQTPGQLRQDFGDSHKKYLLVDPPLSVMDMTKAAGCPSDLGLEPGLDLNHNIVVDGNMGMFKKVHLDFNQTKNCLNVGKGVHLHVFDVVIDDACLSGALRNPLPFFKMHENSRIVLEAVVFMVRPTSPEYSLRDLEKELLSVLEDSSQANITQSSLDSFYFSATFAKASFEYPEAHGLLLENGTIKPSFASANGGKLDFLHTLFVIDESFFPPDKLESSSSITNKSSTKKWGGWMMWLVGIVAAVALASMLGLAFSKFKRRWEEASRIPRVGEYELLLSDSTGCSARTGVEEGLYSSSSSRTEVGVDREHQDVAEKLLDDVTLGHLIGRGAFGQVYKAMWNGAVVAVKVIFHQQKTANGDEDIAREAALSSDLRHPNVVQTFMQATRCVTKAPEQAPATSGHSSASSLGDNPYHAIHDVLEAPEHPKAGPSLQMVSLEAKETWLVQEYCDLGSLGNSLKLKLLGREGELGMDSVISTCADIARGMQYLHSRNVIHGDLKCGNVLLCSSIQDARGFIAKVADFGLSRQMDFDVTHISTNTVGTLTHMPPELLKGRKLVPKGDVYSFGIMMWEIVMGRSPFQGWTAPQLLRAVLGQKWKPAYPDYVPYGFSQLGLQCLSEHPHDRPTFMEVLHRLEALKELGY